MPSKYDILQEKEQDPRTASQELAEMLEIFLSPLLIVLDRFLDKRKVANIRAMLRSNHTFQE